MRRRRPERRRILPDPIYNDLTVAKFINNLMERGKKSLAEKIFYSSLDIIKAKTKENGLEVFRKAISNRPFWKLKQNVSVALHIRYLPKFLKIGKWHWL